VTRRKIHSLKQTHLALLSTIEPNCFEEASKDEFWNKTMDEELDQIEKNDTWELVPRPKNMLEDWLLSLMSTLVMGFGPQY
jgi:hypothetical protein